MQNTVLFLWRSLSKFHPTSLLSKQQHPWFRDWLRIISPIPVTLWGLEPRSWCMQLLGGLGLWSVRWLRMQVMITGKFLSKVFWMWTARVRDDLEEKVVQGSSFDYLTENWRIKQTKKLIQVSMFGWREVWHFMVKFRTWLTVDSPLSFERLQSMFLESLSQEFHRCILKISGMKEFLWYFHSNETSLELQKLTQIFQLPHTVALEPYIRVFQYKVLNGILDTSNPSCMK